MSNKLTIPKTFTQSTIIPDSIQKLLVADQAIEIQHLRLRLQKKSRRQLNLYSNTTAAWAASVSLKHDWQEEILKEKLGAQRVYTLDHMETENAQVGGRIRDIMGEEKEIDENILSTEISLLTLKAHSKNDQKTKGKKKIEEEDESNKSETVKKFLAQQDQGPSGINPPTRITENQMADLLEALVGKLQANELEKTNSRKRKVHSNYFEDDSEKENDELRLHLTITPNEEKEVDYEILDRKYPIKEWKTECLGTKLQGDKAEHLEEINQNVVIRSNRQKRYFSTSMRVLSIFDREDLNAVYQLVMNIYQDEIPEGFDRVLWGDLMVMFNPDDEEKFWNSQQDWNIVSWKLHGSSGVHTLVTESGLVIHMLVEKKYPLRKKVLLQILELKLESEEDNTMALELIRFIKKLLAELEPEDFDGDEEDL
ncbi:hypothetical protein Tco_0790176 [Tanacetum coccineum]